MAVMVTKVENVNRDQEIHAVESKEEESRDTCFFLFCSLQERGTKICFCISDTHEGLQRWGKNMRSTVGIFPDDSMKYR